ncbi:MAG: MogA/MoaB family molybdenum cofactor biosynthesis protein [Candidatus Eisenbacteria bacterium]
MSARRPAPAAVPARKGGGSGDGPGDGPREPREPRGGGSRPRLKLMRTGAHAPHGAPRPVGVAIVTVSDTRGPHDDGSGARAHEMFEHAGHEVVQRAWVRDEIPAIRKAVRALLKRADVDAVLVTGGTGVAPRDVTPEALAPLFSRELPGFGELFRAKSVAQVGAAAWLSRATAGVASGRLLVVLPGSTAAVELALESLLLPELAHAVRLLGRFQP